MTEAALKAEALSYLDGLESITRRERLVRGKYIDDAQFDQWLADEGAVCGGHKACLIGGLFLAAGAKPEYGTVEYGPRKGVPRLIGLEGAEAGQRDEFLADKPAVRLALWALDREAEAAVEAFWTSGDWGPGSYPNEYVNSDGAVVERFRSPAEDYFENVLRCASNSETHAAVLDLVERAKARIAA